MVRIFSTLLISPSNATNNSLRGLKLINFTCKVSVRTPQEMQFESIRTISRSLLWSEIMEKINSVETSRISSIKSGRYVYIYIYIHLDLEGESEVNVTNSTERSLF